MFLQEQDRERLETLRGGGDVTGEAAIGVKWPRGHTSRNASSLQTPEEAKNTLPESFQDCGPASSLLSDFFPPELREDTLLLF